MIVNNIPIGINPVVMNHFNRINLLANQLQGISLFQTTELSKIVGIIQMQFRTIDLFKNSIGSVIASNIHVFKPIFESHQAFHSLMSSELHQNIMKSMSPLSGNNFFTTMSIIPKIDPAIFTIFQNDSFKSAFEHFKHMQLDELSKEENDLFQAHIDEHFIESDKKLLSDFLDVVKETVPELKIMINSLQDKNYTKFMIAMFVSLILHFVMLKTVDYFTENTHYRINKENTSIKATPSRVAKDNVITTLSRNIYVEKIDSGDNGWVKIRFEMSDGKIEEGWVYKTMLSKIE